MLVDDEFTSTGTALSEPSQAACGNVQHENHHRHAVRVFNRKGTGRLEMARPKVS